MSVADETLFAFIDGELPPDEMERIALLVATDEALAERVERQHRLVAEARADMDRDLAAPLPQAWIAAIDARLAPATTVASLAVARERKQRNWWPVGTAIAASLVAGLGFGATMLAPRAGLVSERGGALIASRDLSRALDVARSGTPVRLASGKVTVKLSVRRPDGAFCRDAAISDRESYRILACRDDAGWSVQALIREDGAAFGYQQASGDSAIDAAIDALGGEPLDATSEAEAVSRGWRKKGS